MIKGWVIYTLMFGYGIPTYDDASFTTESACQIYLATKYRESVRDTFKVYCTYVGPLMCQGKPCQ